MIQRVQTIYLFFAASCSALTFVIPIASFNLRELTETQTLHLNALGIQANDTLVATSSAWYITLFVVMAVVMSIISIFSYKNRKNQARKCISILLANLLAVIGTGMYSYGVQLDEKISFKFAWGFVLLLAAVIFTFMARRAILRDEALVRAADRLR